MSGLGGLDASGPAAATSDLIAWVVLGGIALIGIGVIGFVRWRRGRLRTPEQSVAELPAPKQGALDESARERADR